MSERTIVVCDNSGVEITPDMFRITAKVTFGGGPVSGRTMELDFATARDCADFVLKHDPLKTATAATQTT